MRRRSKEVARLAAVKGYRLQRENPRSGDFWLWGHSDPDIPLVVGSFETIEAFFTLDEMHQITMEANASFAMKHGLEALAGVHGPSAIAELSRPVREAAAFHDEQVKAGTIEPFSFEDDEPVKVPPVVDDRPWRLLDGGNEVVGFYVSGYRTSQTSGSVPALYGPYPTLEDAEAVVANRDSDGRPLRGDAHDKLHRGDTPDTPPPPPPPDLANGWVMRCQHVDDDTQCRMDATRRVAVVVGHPPDPDQAEFAGTVYLIQVCEEHDPGPRRSMPLPRPPESVPIGQRPRR